jgi:hypothetical protein
MSKIIIYTAITEGYDKLNPVPEAWRGQARFVAFLGRPQRVAGWEIQPIYRRFRDPCRNAKIHKILSHVYFPDAEYTLWVDGSVKIKSTLPIDLWSGKFLRNHDLAVFKHRQRDCVYAEALANINSGRDNINVISRQMEKYFDEGYPSRSGLAECTVLFRRHSRLVKWFNEKWYAEIKTYSRRDQLSFNYVAHKVGLKYKHLPGIMTDNAHFAWLPHASVVVSQPKGDTPFAPFGQIMSFRSFD